MSDEKGSYTAISIMSPTLAFLMVLNGLFRLFLYLVIYKGYSFDDISFVLATGIEETRGRRNESNIKEAAIGGGGGSSITAPLDENTDKAKNPMHITLSSGIDGQLVLRQQDASTPDLSFLKTENSMQKEEIEKLKSEIKNLRYEKEIGAQQDHERS